VNMHRCWSKGSQSNSVFWLWSSGPWWAEHQAWTGTCTSSI